jgi:hypothetical protein
MPFALARVSRDQRTSCRRPCTTHRRRRTISSTAGRISDSGCPSGGSRSRRDRFLWSDESPVAATVLAEAACQAQQGFRCTLKLPKTLASGARYWIASQYQSLDGLWVTVQVVAGASLSNPVAFAAR